MINNIVKKISLKDKRNYKIILTGGYAKLFKKYIKNKSIIDQNVTIKGVAEALKKLNEKEELIFCPLGGSGEIGMNMNLYAYGTEEKPKMDKDMGLHCR